MDQWSPNSFEHIVLGSANMFQDDPVQNIVLYPALELFNRMLVAKNRAIINLGIFGRFSHFVLNSQASQDQNMIQRCINPQALRSGVMSQRRKRPKVEKLEQSRIEGWPFWSFSSSVRMQGMVKTSFKDDPVHRNG
jgi:hypothetical protein